jgi:hypothetical protein
MIKSQSRTKNAPQMIPRTAKNKVRKITKALLLQKNNTFLRERLEYWRKLL